MAVGTLIILLGLCVYEVIKLYQLLPKIHISRALHPKLSLGDDYQIKYFLENKSSQVVKITLFDEFPEQLQQRQAIGVYDLEEQSDLEAQHQICPKLRGQFEFKNMIAYISRPTTQLMEIRKDFIANETIKVVPSILQMKKYSLYTLKRASHLVGLKKIRTIGENDEFELIRNYQQGDNMKSINWKATSRTNTLMVNQFQDTRSQEVISIIDKGRTMEMPFNGLSLLDYAINSALVISNIVLQKSDKAGLITFSKNIDTFFKSDSKTNQLQLIMEYLYAQKTNFSEHNFELLNNTLHRKVSRRSIIFLYTNFENLVEVERNIRFIEMINKNHVLVLINFINTELEQSIEEQNTYQLEQVYTTAMAQKIYYERYAIEILLKKRGIQCIFTKPENLNINVINKYLEIKAKRTG
jgi:uncharacterized protein (DUF58 family)